VEQEDENKLLLAGVFEGQKEKDVIFFRERCFFLAPPFNG